MFKDLKITEYIIANQSTRKGSMPDGINVFVTYGIFLPYALIIKPKACDLVLINIQTIFFFFAPIVSKTESEINTLFCNEFAQPSCGKTYFHDTFVQNCGLAKVSLWSRYFLHISFSVEKLNKPKLKFSCLKHQHKLCVGIGQKEYKKHHKSISNTETVPCSPPK